MYCMYVCIDDTNLLCYLMVKWWTIQSVVRIIHITHGSYARKEVTIVHACGWKVLASNETKSQRNKTVLNLLGNIMHGMVRRFSEVTNSNENWIFRLHFKLYKLWSGHGSVPYMVSKKMCNSNSLFFRSKENAVVAVMFCSCCCCFLLFCFVTNERPSFMQKNLVNVKCNGIKIVHKIPLGHQIEIPVKPF